MMTGSLKQTATTSSAIVDFQKSVPFVYMNRNNVKFNWFVLDNWSFMFYCNVRTSALTIEGSTNKLARSVKLSLTGALLPLCTSAGISSSWIFQRTLCSSLSPSFRRTFAINSLNIGMNISIFGKIICRPKVVEYDSYQPDNFRVWLRWWHFHSTASYTVTSGIPTRQDFWFYRPILLELWEKKMHMQIQSNKKKTGN